MHFGNKVTHKTYTCADIGGAIGKPVIIHFTGTSKPWFYLNRHPYKNVYWQYLKQTPFAGFQPPDRNLKNLILKQIPPEFKNMLVKQIPPGMKRSIKRLWGIQ